MRASDDIELSCSVTGGGCLLVVLSMIALWVVVFGVTINGEHWGMDGCTPESGVKIDVPGK